MIECMRNAACEHMTLDEQISFCEEKSKNIKLKAKPQTFVDIKNSLEKLKNPLIPYSERLPEPIRPVLVTLRNWMNDKYFVRAGRFHTDHWKTDEGIVENSIVIAWQPLPQPYQPKGE